MAWNSYGLDQEAQKLVLLARTLDESTLNQAYKMRTIISYGLERFWGEHLRLQNREPTKSRYWKATWDALVRIMALSGISLPNDSVKVEDVQSVQLMSEKLWQLNVADSAGSPFCFDSIMRLPCLVDSKVQTIDLFKAFPTKFKLINWHR